MNCNNIRQRILQSDSVTRLAPKLRTHLDECAACVAWYGQAAKIEAMVAELEAPAPEQKETFLDSFREAAILPFLPQAPTSHPPKKDLGRRKLAAAFAMASALLLCVIGGWLWQQYGVNPDPTEPKSELTRRLEKDRGWTRAREPRHRLIVLERHCHQITVDALDAARNGAKEQLQQQVALFHELVEEKMLPEAERIDPAERSVALSATIQALSHSESEATRLAAELPASAPELQELAAVARHAERRLRKLF